jgi:hypothetical protein
MARQSGFECIEITKPDGTVTPPVCADATTDDTIHPPDIYVGAQLDRAFENGNALVTVFQITSYRCLDTNCDLKARGSTTLPVSVSYRSSAGVVTVGPRPSDELLGKQFMVGKFSCFAEYFYYDEGAASPTFLSEFQAMQGDHDLHGNVTCPDLADDLCVGMITSTVSTAGGRPVYLFQNDCQVSSSLHEVTSAPDRQSFTFIMDPIGEVRSEGQVDHTTQVAIVLCDSIDMTADAMSTHEAKTCRDASFVEPFVPNANSSRRGLQELDSGTLMFTYEVEGSGSIALWQILVIIGLLLFVVSVAVAWCRRNAKGAAQQHTDAMADPNTLQCKKDVEAAGGRAGFVAP